MKKILFIITLGITNLLFSQNLQNANWCFGTHAGINFNTTPQTPFWSAMPAHQNEVWHEGAGQASVSDKNGVLQFYTDGLTVWDKNHQVLTNGAGLFGYSEIPGLQRVVIIPKPKKTNIYYVFTLGTIYTSQIAIQPPLGNGGIHYSIVDMTPGNERVVPGLKNISMNNHNGIAVDYPLNYSTSPASPVYITQHSRMTTSLHGDADKIWLSIVADFDPNNNQVHNRYFYNYLVTENGIIDGISGAVVPDGVSPGPQVATLLNNSDYPLTQWIAGQYWGTMKVSPDGTLLGDSENGAVNLYGYNNSTGNIGPPPLPLIQHVYITPIPYFVGSGLEFSPDSRLIYFSETATGIMQGPKAITGVSLTDHDENMYATLYQYDTQTDSLRVIHKVQIIPPGKDIVIPIDQLARPFGMQLGLDSRIYVCNYAQVLAEHDRLGVIQFPNTVGVNCAFDPDGLMLVPNTYHNQGLPQWVHRVPPIWPKVYEGFTGNNLIIDNSPSGNILASFFGTNLVNNINHEGAPVPTGVGHYCVQFNKTTGITNWIQQNERPSIILNSGDAHLDASPLYPFGPFIMKFRNAITGIISPGPGVTIPSDEMIRVEDNGVFITMNRLAPQTFKVRSASGVSSTPFFQGIPPVRMIYNPVSKKLFANYMTLVNNQNYYLLAVYSLNNNQLTLLNSPWSNVIHSWMFQVNNNDEVFMSFDNKIQKYDYVSNTVTELIVPGFTNANVRSLGSLNINTEDRITTIVDGDNHIYCINTNTLGLRKIPYTHHPIHYFAPEYLVEGDNLFLNGEVSLGDVTIGNQTIPVLGSRSVFVTKFNIQTDFSLRSPVENFVSNETLNKTMSKSALQNKTDEIVTKYAIKATLSPNPAKNILLINLKQKGKETASSFVVSVANTLGVNMLTQTTKQNMLTVDVSRFKPGMYYLTISTDKGDKTTQMFMKE